MLKVACIVFPGTNCDHDIEHLCGHELGAQVSLVWHRDVSLAKSDIVILPGGFAHGDYLRTGALAKVSPIMNAVRAFAAAGGPVVGICNGFQILCECELLPGALLQNIDRRFLSQFVHMQVASSNSPLTRGVAVGTRIVCPIAHGEGNYYADAKTLAELEDRDEVIFRYARSDGTVVEADRDANPNGAAHAIAGICNKARNVVGLMPHPERSAESLVGAEGGKSGRMLFEALLAGASLAYSVANSVQKPYLASFFSHSSRKRSANALSGLRLRKPCTSAAETASKLRANCQYCG